jgi:hypothetical protein
MMRKEIAGDPPQNAKGMERPLRLDVPCQNRFVASKQLHILSWKMDNFDANQISYLLALKKILEKEKNKFHFITLQNISNKAATAITRFVAENIAGYSSIRAKIIHEEKDENGYWVKVEEENEEILAENGALTLFNIHQFSLVLDEKLQKLQELAYPHLNGNISTFKSLFDPTFTVTICNSNQENSISLNAQENSIKTFFLNHADTFSIVTGYFNIPIAPLHSNFKLSSILKQGGFYQSNNPAQKRQKQASFHLIDPETGDILNQNLPTEWPDDLNTLPFYQIIGIDDCFQFEKKINSQWTIFEYERHLQAIHADTDITVRMAKNNINQSGVGIRVNQAIYHALSKLAITQLMLQMEQNNYFVYVRAKDIKLLLCAMEAVQLVNNINVLKAKEPAMTPILDHLSDAIQKETNKTNPAYGVIVSHFNHIIQHLLKKPMTMKEVQQAETALSNDLSGKPPLSPALMTAKYALSGLIVGLALGTALGLCASGFGIIPLAMVGACLLGAAVGGMSGFTSLSVVGFFQARHQQRNYQTSKKIIPLSADLIGETQNLKRFAMK